MHANTPSIFATFLRFGLLAWGGPVAQIGLLREQLVEHDSWLEPEQFNRALAVYQALPGPEALEMCIYLGTIRGGRRGGLAAGLGFLLPGLLLVLAVAWAYTTYGIRGAVATGVLWGCAPAAAALVIRALVKLGRRTVHNSWLAVIALLGGASQVAQLPFVLPLAGGGAVYALARSGRRASRLAGVLLACCAVATTTAALKHLDSFSISEIRVERSASAHEARAARPEQDVPDAEIAVSGARAGLLTFGGAYTAIPYVERDAVIRGDWVTRTQFVDSLVIAGAIPAPLVMFATFIGYLASGLAGALVMTIAICTPAFVLTLAGHRHLQRLVDSAQLHAALDGVTAAVVGLMATTTLSITWSAVQGPGAAVVYLASLMMLARLTSRWSIVITMLAAGSAGIIVHLVR
jgi:chromate transporter